MEQIRSQTPETSEPEPANVRAGAVVSAVVELDTATTNPHPLAWKEEGRCRGAGPIVMHPEDGDEKAEAHAKNICGPCPVAAKCLDYALNKREKLGVWGGHTERERRRILRHRSRAQD